jgi:hypothetical protein
MKPELTVQDFGGAMSHDMEKTFARLIKGGSWKKQRIIVVIPAGESIPAKVALTHWNLMFPPNNGVVRILAQGMEVGDAYTAAIENILAHPDLKDWEYLLTLEHDNTPPPDGVIKLIERMEQHPEFACIGGLYFTKGYGGVAQIWGDVNDPILNFRPQPPNPNGELVECCGTGMGFNLFRLSMFKDERIPRPWFKTKRGMNGEGVGTQDLTFWSEARKYGYRCAIDCAVRVGHYDLAGTFGQSDFTW